jgi:flagellar protein FliO/FliZ
VSNPFTAPDAPQPPRWAFAHPLAEATALRRSGDGESPDRVVAQPAPEASDYEVAVRIGCRPPSRTGAAVRRATVYGALLATALALPACALAIQRDETPLPKGVVDGATTGAAQETSSSGGIARMIVGLAIVLAVIYGVYWLLKSYRKAKSTAGDGRIEVVATTTLAPNRSVHLIRVGEELVLVGSADHGITRLRVYDADQAAQLLPLLESAATSSRLLPSRRDGGQSCGVARVVEDLRWRTVRR